MGRSSSRIAHRKTQVPVESEGEHSEDNEDEWTYPEKRGSIGPRVPKKIKRDKTLPPVPPPRKAATNKQPLRGNNNCNGLSYLVSFPYSECLGSLGMRLLHEIRSLISSFVFYSTSKAPRRSESACRM